MTCYHPLKGWRGKKNEEGRRPIVFSRPPASLSLEPNFSVPCGQCVGCRLAYSRMWAIRCVHEASLHADNCFITLTYNDDNLTWCTLKDGSCVGTLVKRDVQLFVKRLRKKFPVRIRFFCCGEYGELLTRPHYHLILFGFNFPDRIFWKCTNGVNLYRSKFLESLWTYGYSSVGDVTFESAAYVARYCLKKRNGLMKAMHYRNLVPEFSLMSRKPGIARDWFEKFEGDVFPHDFIVIRDGIKCKPPRYYDKIYDLTNPEGMDIVRETRMKSAMASVDNTPERLAVRKKVQESKLPLLERSLDYET